MKKKLVSIITVLVLIACGIFVVVSNKKNETNLNNAPNTKVSESNKENKDDKTTNNTNSNTETTTEENTNNETVEEDKGYVEVKEKDLPDWTDFEVSINGENFKLPVLYKDFEKTGYKIPDIREDDKFAPLQILQRININDDNGHTIYVNIENKTNDEVDTYHCYITGISISSDNKSSEYLFPGNITFGSTYDEVIEKLGAPITEYQANDNKTAVWNINNLYSYAITFDSNNQVIEISMNNADS